MSTPAREKCPRCRQGVVRREVDGLWYERHCRDCKGTGLRPISEQFGESQTPNPESMGNPDPALRQANTKSKLGEMARLSRDIDELIGERGKLIKEAFPVGTKIAFYDHGMDVEAEVIFSGFGGIDALQSNSKEMPFGALSIPEPWAEHRKLRIL